MKIVENNEVLYRVPIIDIKAGEVFALPESFFSSVCLAKEDSSRSYTPRYNYYMRIDFNNKGAGIYENSLDDVIPCVDIDSGKLLLINSSAYEKDIMAIKVDSEVNVSLSRSLI